MADEDEGSKKSLIAYKKQAIQAAWDLNYGSEVVQKIMDAKTEGRVAQIMTTERKRRLI